MIALSADRESETRPTYPCLEVWDAFGELQILVNENGREVTSAVDNHPVQVVGQSSTTTPVVSSPVLAREMDIPPKKSKPETSKTRRSKGTRKAKNSTHKRDKDIAESSEGEKQQLFMEFPTKKSN